MSTYASDLMAGVYRNQWELYKKQYVPMENELIKSYQSPAIRSRMLAEATRKTDQAFDTAEGIYGRSMARITPTQDATQQAETKRMFGMNRTLSQVDARNRTRQGLVAMDQAILGGGVTSGGIQREDGQ